MAFADPGSFQGKLRSLKPAVAESTVPVGLNQGRMEIQEVNRKSLLLFGLVTGLALSQGAVADEKYIVPSVIYTNADNDRLVDDDISGIEIALGKFHSDKIAVEGRLGAHGLSGVDDVDMLELTLAGLWTFRRDHNLSPYLMLGAGVIKSDSDLLGDDLAPALSYGAGVNFSFDRTPMGLRLEYRVRHTHEDPFEPRDDLVSLGFVFPFGEKDEPAAVPVAAAAPVAAPDPDSDGDGVPDSRDACLDTPAGHAVDQRGCSLDSDGDGVVDANDQCPDTAEGARVDVNGCEIKEVIELPGVNFESNSDRLLPGADNVLRDAAATLQKHPDLIVEVAGHTDSVGDAAYNQGLSERRAKTVRDYLIGAGAAADNLSARGYGEADPIADNDSDEGRATNRRVELRIVEQ